MLAEADALAVAPETELLDGAHAHLAGAAPVCESSGTLADLRAWADAASSLPDETEIVFGADIALDLPSPRAELTGCGEHVGVAPSNVLVLVHPLCHAC